MLNVNQITVVRSYLERRFNTLNVVFIKSTITGCVFEVNEQRFFVDVDGEFNVTMSYELYGKKYMVRGGYSLGLLEGYLISAK